MREQNSIRKVVKRKVLFRYSIRVRHCQTTAAKIRSSEKWLAGMEPWIPTPNIDVMRQAKTFSIYFPRTINLRFSAVLCCIRLDLIRLPTPLSNLQQISFMCSESNVLRTHISMERALEWVDLAFIQYPSKGCRCSEFYYVFWWSCMLMPIALNPFCIFSVLPHWKA